MIKYLVAAFLKHLKAPQFVKHGSSLSRKSTHDNDTGDVRIKMGYAPEQQLKDKNVCVIGRVILFKEKPEIIIYNIMQLQVQQ